MDDYGRVIYLDVQKTGSTYISAFMKAHLNLKQREFNKHADARRPIDEDAFYFASLRNPIHQWLSLYQYGCLRKGLIWKRLHKSAEAAVKYDGSKDDFEHWCRYALDPANAAVLGGGYEKVESRLYGLQTFRFLKLCLRNPAQCLSTAVSRTDLVRVYQENHFTQYVVQTETLRADLIDLCNSHLEPFLADKEKAIAFLQQSGKRNISAKPLFTLDDVSPDLTALMRSREWFLFEQFYPYDGDRPQDALPAHAPRKAAG